MLLELGFPSLRRGPQHQCPCGFGRVVLDTPRNSVFSACGRPGPQPGWAFQPFPMFMFPAPNVILGRDHNLQSGFGLTGRFPKAFLSKENVSCVVWKERRWAVPLARMEGVTGLDSVHTGKALLHAWWCPSTVFASVRVCGDRRELRVWWAQGTVQGNGIAMS